MSLDLIFKIILIIVVVGIALKAIKFITGLVFKIAFILLFLFLVYKLFVGI